MVPKQLEKSAREMQNTLLANSIVYKSFSFSFFFPFLQTKKSTQEKIYGYNVHFHVHFSLL